MTTLSILIPTAGRPLIERAILSYLPQMQAEDELLVLGDTAGGPLHQTEAICARYAPLVRYVPCGQQQHSWGHAELNTGLIQARCDYLVTNDDDDVAAPDALATIRRTVAGLDRALPLLFRFRSYYGPIFWEQAGDLRENHVGGHCAVFPNLPGRVGRYTDRYQGDFDYIRSTLDLWPNGADDVRWVDAIIAIARPAL